MGETIKSIEVDVPVRTAYNQWTQFEEFPHFMEGVEKVEQVDDTHLRWQVDIAGVEREFDAEITEQTPDQRVAWRSRSGVDQGGVVSFHALDDDTTKVTLQMDFDPEGAAEQIGDKMGMVSSRIEGDLERFKDFIENRGAETGAWRGEVERS